MGSILTNFWTLILLPIIARGLLFFFTFVNRSDLP